ncbi:MAG: zinc-ribbon domain-containing protein [Ruminococcaceae bacterium]|nr:zinc-ribbon domain-containing protein [Oscillospiraceae bacterium]
MFCPNCGSELPENSAFCEKCGAALGHTAQSGPVLTQDPSLPEGIFRDGNGAYHWVYHLDMKRNPVPLLVLLKIMVYICGGMAVIIFFMTWLNHNTLAAAVKAFAIVFFGIGGFLVVIIWTAWLVVMKIHGGNYTVEHLMTEDRVEHLQTQEEIEQSKKVKTLVFVLGMLSDDPGAMGLAMGGQEELTSRYADVKKIIASPRHDLIKVNNVLQHNHIYAYPHQYKFVWNYLTSHCPNARVQG